ncbi:Rha family transcriptional regulator [Paracoccus beibuensis]|uniref:Rha family transcriptional regulator n=1 Tax=Paracoccus beibuensis TaxID=547602 RepID=UPI00223EEE59|nr:Rha family transcriptional regulator [Paracoccus beibuensis]
MSSREIAKLCEKRHDNVMSDISKMLADIGLHAPDFSGTYKTERGNTYDCFNLAEYLVLTLVSGYRTDRRYRIIKDLERLRKEKSSGGFALPDFTDPGAAARAWAEQFEANRALQIERAEG